MHRQSQDTAPTLFQSAPASLRRENRFVEHLNFQANRFQSAPASLRRENSAASMSVEVSTSFNPLPPL